jgi:hypothetical protein
MKRWRIVKINPKCVLIAAVLAGGCADAPVETSTNRYANYAEAMKDGAFQRGWLPGNLPDSAYANMDTNELLVSFKYASTDIDEFLDKCIATSNLELPAAGRTKKVATWWPKILTDSNQEKMPDALQAYRCRNMPHATTAMDANLVLKPQETTAWYWISR